MHTQQTSSLSIIKPAILVSPFELENKAFVLMLADKINSGICELIWTSSLLKMTKFVDPD